MGPLVPGEGADKPDPQRALATNARSGGQRVEAVVGDDGAVEGQTEPCKVFRHERRGGDREIECRERGTRGLETPRHLGRADVPRAGQCGGLPSRRGRGRWRALPEHAHGAREHTARTAVRREPGGGHPFGER